MAEHFDREDVEAVVACLGDDAAQLREENSEDERAANMDRAASILTWMLLTHPVYRVQDVVAEPQGWKLVPVEPTPDMIAAACIAVLPTPDAEAFERCRQAARIVMAMPQCPPGVTVEGLAGAMATIVPAHRAMLAAAAAHGRAVAFKDEGEKQ